MTPPRALFWHAESDCYFEAIGQEEIDAVWESNDGLVEDVSGVAIHEDEFLRIKDADRNA